MGEEEVYKVSDKKLITEWQRIKLVFRTGVYKHFDKNTFNLFLNAVTDVSEELRHRGIDH
jgi:hypothetical protein